MTVQTLSTDTVSPAQPEAEIAQEYRATYSPDDNKLRLYALYRLDDETFKRVKEAGFKWAPKQQLFVAPMWTPYREDLLIELAGAIEDEDQTLFDRQEERAERFDGYSEKRAAESAQALDAVDRIASVIPFGQPILVGHHSERRARRDAKRIENGMRRAVNLFETSEYWEQRAAASLRLAAYKERPDVRWRRIKKIETDLRRAEKDIAKSEAFLKLWRSEKLDLNMALVIANRDFISCRFPLDRYPRPAEVSQYEGMMSLWSAITDGIINAEQARDIATPCHERSVRWKQRWTTHYRNRLSYERAMLAEKGGILAEKTEFQPGGLVKSRGEWLKIIRVNKVRGEVSSVTTPHYSILGYKGTMKLTPDCITEYQAPTDEETDKAKAAAKRPPIVNYPDDDFKVMTKAEWAAKPSDYKAVRSVAATDTQGAYRYRRVMDNYSLVYVYISDLKTVAIPEL